MISRHISLISLLKLSSHIAHMFEAEQPLGHIQSGVSIVAPRVSSHACMRGEKSLLTSSPSVVRKISSGSGTLFLKNSQEKYHVAPP